MKIGTNIGVSKFQENYEQLKDYTDFIELFYGEPQDISKVKPYQDIIKTIHLPDLNKQVFEAMDDAYALSVEKAIVHFFTFPQENFTEKITALRRLDSIADDYGIQLCLENTGENLRLMEILFEYLPEMAFCLDIGHANLFRSNPVDFISAFGSRLHHIHIHDNHGGFQFESDLHLAPGEGDIDFTPIFQMLKELNYREHITFEGTPWDTNQRKIEAITNIRKMIQETR